MPILCRPARKEDLEKRVPYIECRFGRMAERFAGLAAKPMQLSNESR
jgi:hypothetical protein